MEKFFISLISIFLFLPVQVIAAPPGIPMVAQGNVTINGEPAPTGTVVSAKINDSNAASTETAKEGKYSLAISKNKKTENRSLTLYVGNVKTDQELRFKSGKIEKINLHITKSNERNSPTKGKISNILQRKNMIYIGIVILLIVLMAGYYLKKG